MAGRALEWDQQCPKFVQNLPAGRRQDEGMGAETKEEAKEEAKPAAPVVATKAEVKLATPAAEKKEEANLTSF